MKNVLSSISLVVLIFFLNFGLFLFTYKKLVFPYLHEAQRLENASLIFSYVLVGFLVLSIISVVLCRLFNKSKVVSK